MTGVQTCALPISKSGVRQDQLFQDAANQVNEPFVTIDGSEDDGAGRSSTEIPAAMAYSKNNSITQAEPNWALAIWKWNWQSRSQATL